MKFPPGIRSLLTSTSRLGLFLQRLGLSPEGPVSPWGWILLWLVVAGLYVALGTLSLSRLHINNFVAAFWLPTGLVTALALKLGYGVLPGVLLGETVIGFLFGTGPAWSHVATGFSQCLEGVAIGYFAPRWMQGQDIFASLRNLLAFWGAALVGDLFHTLFGAMLIPYLAGKPVSGEIFSWFIGGWGGALILAPFLLSWWMPHRRGPGRDLRRLEFWGLLFLLTAVVLMINWEVITLVSQRPQAFVIPLLLWGAFRFQIAGTALLNLLFTLLFLFIPHHEFDLLITPTSLAQVQLIIISSVAMALVVAVVNGDRNRLAQQLKLEALSLEQRVLDRTAELERAQAELTQLNSELEQRVEQRTADLVALSQRLTMALKAGKIGCWDYDLQRNQAVWDDQMCEIYGYEPLGDQPVPDDYWSRVLHPEDWQKLEALRVQIEEDSTLQQYEMELRILRPDSPISYVLAYGLIFRDDQDKPVKIIGLNQDVTKQRQAEQRLQQTNEELLRANRIKDEFLAIMSHELRTPLNAVLGMSESLQEEIFGPLNPQQQQALQTIEKSGEHLLNLINDILDLSKIEANQLQLNPSPTAIADLCQASVLLVLPQANKKQIQLTRRIPRDLPKLLIDQRRLRQALINLLNNAVKFTPVGGQVCLEVLYLLRAPVPAEARPVIRFIVQDTGIGIAPENLKKLFQPFVQIDSALNRKYDGTGLGLALVKRLVELQGGEVGVSSELGVGSCFWIDLPCPEGTVFPESIDGNAMTLATIEQSGVKPMPLILLAEDNPASVLTIQSYLEAKGYHLMVAEDGEAAIRMTYEHQPQLILMDIQMPKLNGIQAIEQLRQNPQFQKLPIIALTALAMEGDEQRCLAAGASAYLSKPVKLKQLLHLIESFQNSMN